MMLSLCGCYCDAVGRWVLLLQYCCSIVLLRCRGALGVIVMPWGVAALRGVAPRRASMSHPYPSVPAKRIRTRTTPTHPHIHHMLASHLGLRCLTARAALSPLLALASSRARRFALTSTALLSSRRHLVLWYVCRSFWEGFCATCFARTQTVVVVNYSPEALVARVAGKEGGAGARMLQELLAGRDCLLRDRLSEYATDIYGDTFTGARAR